MPLAFALFGIGLFLIIIGAWFNFNAARADPWLKERYRLPFADALAPPPGTPDRLTPLGDWQHRVRLHALAIAVTGAKIGPVAWRVGIGLVLTGVLGVILS